MGTTMLFMLMSLVILMSDAGQCPDSWSQFSVSCYRFITDKVTWFEAQVVCANAKSTLINIQSKAEDDFAVQMARSHESSVWIGLSDLWQEGVFKWDTLQDYTYTNWGPNQPDNAGGSENCVSLREDINYTWSDERCELKFSTICERYVF